MKKFYNKEQYIAYANQQNMNRSSACSALRIVMETIKELDGKLYNVRFTRSLNEKLLKVHLDNTYLSVEQYGVYLYVRDNDSYKNDPRLSYSSWSYVDYTYYLPDLFKADKKINASATIPLLEERLNKIIGDINKSSVELAKIDDIEKAYNVIKNEMEDFNKSITYNLQELFSFKGI